MEQKQSTENQLGNAELLEEIRQLRREVAKVKPRRGLFSKMRGKAKGFMPWLVNGLAPVGDADDVTEQNAVVQFLAGRMKSWQGKVLLLAISAAVFIFWGVMVMLIMK